MTSKQTAVCALLNVSGMDQARPFQSPSLRTEPVSRAPFISTPHEGNTQLTSGCHLGNPLLPFWCGSFATSMTTM